MDLLMDLLMDLVMDVVRIMGALHIHALNCILFDHG